MKIYVASSWRNTEQPFVVTQLRAAGHEVYDFRHPKPGDDGFRWTDVDPGWQTWTPEQYRYQLLHPRAVEGFYADMNALNAADAVVLVMPCGRSAHLEAGYARGAGKRLVILLASGEPELMYKMADRLAVSIDEVLAVLQKLAG